MLNRKRKDWPNTLNDMGRMNLQKEGYKMDKPMYIEAYVYGLEKMLEEARQTIARLSKELDAMNKEQAALRESKQGVEKRLGEIIN